MVINNNVLSEISQQIKTFINSYSDFCTSIEGIDFINCDQNSANQLFGGWLNQILLEKRILFHICQIWPDGIQFANKFNELIVAQEDCVNHWAIMRKFIKEWHESKKNQSMEEYKRLIEKNRILSPRIDKLLIETNEVLKGTTGLDMFEGMQQEDVNEIDTSKEGIIRTRIYIEKVREVVCEYQSFFLLLLDHHNESISSPELYKNMRWVSESKLLAVKLRGIILGNIPGKVTPNDLNPPSGCQDIYIRLRNLKDLSEELDQTYSEALDRKDYKKLLEATDVMDQIITGVKNIYPDIEKVSLKLPNL